MFRNAVYVPTWWLQARVPVVKNADPARTSWLQARMPAVKNEGLRTYLVFAGTRACCQKLRFTHSPGGRRHACLLSKIKVYAPTWWLQARVPVVKNADLARTSWLQARVPAVKN